MAGKGKAKAHDEEEMTESVRDFEIGDEETDDEGERLPLTTSISR